MIALVRRLHIFAGLLNFSFLVIFGLAGLVVTFDAPDIFHAGNEPVVTQIAFQAPPSASDKEVGQLIGERIRPANAGINVRRNPAHQLVVDFYSVNGLVRATLDEAANQLRVEKYRNSIWRFFDNAHATTISEQNSGSSIYAWAWLIEFSIWSLIFMALTGLWLGLGARWQYRWTGISLAAGGVAFMAFWILEK